MTDEIKIGKILNREEYMKGIVRHLNEFVDESQDAYITDMARDDEEPFGIIDIFRMHDGLMLTKTGYELMIEVFEYWEFSIIGDDSEMFTMRQKLNLARNIQCPYFMYDRTLCVFKDEYATMIKLMEMNGQDVRDFAMAMGGT